jgi:hypothetical protein
VDGHRDDERRFVVRADEKLTAFLQLESLVRNEKRKAEHPEQSLLPMFKMREVGGQTGTSGRDLSRDRP